MEHEAMKIGDRVRLITDSFEDHGLLEDDTGTVVDLETKLFSSFSMTDIRVAWDNFGEESWVSLEDCEIE